MWAVLIIGLLAGCGDRPWNYPYEADLQEENLFYGSFSERPKHLDPAVSYSASEVVFTGQIYEPPLQYHYLKRPYELEALTAEALPQPTWYDSAGVELDSDASPSLVTKSVYQIKIKPGIVYQPHPAFAKDASGEYLYHQLTDDELENIYAIGDFAVTGTRELVAADYVYQIKRLAHPKLHSPILGLMSAYIEGLAELSEELNRLHQQGEEIDLTQIQLSGVRELDRYTYEITIKGKYPQFAYWLAMPFFAPMPPEADRFYNQPGLTEKNVSLDWYPIGTGPYMLVENNPNRRMVMLKNPNYRQDDFYPVEGLLEDKENGLLQDAGKPMPFIEKAIYSREVEAIPTWNKFLQGYYDTSGVSSESFDQVVQFGSTGDAVLTEEIQDKGIRLVTSVAATSFYTGFNMLDPVIGGYSEQAKKLRRAISIAMDYEEYISIFRNGRGIPSHGPIPPGIFGYLPERLGINPLVYSWQQGEAVRHSLDEAKQLLAEAGYPDGRSRETGKPLILYFDVTATGPDAKAWLDWLRKQFKKINIQLVTRTTDYNRFQDKMRKGTAQIFQWGWNADYPDPENFLFLLYGPNGKAQYQGENAANYANAEFDRLFEQMRYMENGPERQQIINKMVQVAREDAPWVWGFHPTDFGLYHQWYQNAKPNLMANNTLKYKRIDAERRRQLQAEWNRPKVWPVVFVLLVLLSAVVAVMWIYRQREHRKIEPQLPI